MAEGRIIKAISGFYYVKSGNGVFQCRGRGVFRKQNITPLVGDFVEFDEQNPGEGYILSIKSRRNMLIRPAVANIDQAIIVSSIAEPDFNPLLLDRFLVMIESKEMTPIILMTKKDLKTETDLESIHHYKTVYEQIGYSVKLISAVQPGDLDDLMHELADQVSVIAGQSGVGKSSLLNALNSSLQLKTGDISASLGRGKHTTRHVELVEVGGGLVADTPGFSTLDFKEMAADELADCFPEIRNRQTDCKFRGCYHNKEPECAVKQAVEDGEIAEIRYDHYLRFLDEINSRKPRY
ncbi:ribosome small subunit-dependent GTPase A [Lentibacillus sp. CBA3610]|uniref:ribosome small subunit-dependent GTPase A n=1 Tax=Lentibacillus sp. CBA3610 TaxID=2518176 RepID=UPI0015962058|nr:ribosome small subunit-dependent GTPase A [Lentibacillus sp. CBA3610]QKY68992.1 ribosome small subunit-dependent GTPase A [Lentibacillus sp. CBA3610]